MRLILKDLKKEWNTLIDLLETRQKRLVEKRLGQGKIEIKSEADTEGIDSAQVMGSVNLIINQVFEMLDKYLALDLDENGPDENKKWSKHLGAWESGENCEELYDDLPNDAQTQKDPLHYLIPWNQPTTVPSYALELGSNTKTLLETGQDIEYTKLWIKWLRERVKDETPPEDENWPIATDSNPTFLDKVSKQMEG